MALGCRFTLRKSTSVTGSSSDSLSHVAQNISRQLFDVVCKKIIGGKFAESIKLKYYAKDLSMTIQDYQVKDVKQFPMTMVLYTWHVLRVSGMSITFKQKWLYIQWCSPSGSSILVATQGDCHHRVVMDLLQYSPWWLWYTHHLFSGKGTGQT